MSFFDDLTKKAKIVANAASEKAREAADSAKISADIIKERRELDKNYRAIGEWFANEYEGEIPDAVRDLMEAIQTGKAKIAELEASKPGKGAFVVERVSAGKNCPICGVVADSKFCPQCGAPMD